MNSPNEEIQLDFIGPITEENRRFYILLSIDRCSIWPAASLCKITDGETAVKFLQQYIQLNGIPKTIRTDKASAFTGRFFREFCKKNYISIRYATPYIHTPTGLVERGVRTLKEKITNEYKSGRTIRKSSRPSTVRDADYTTHQTKKIGIRTTLRKGTEHGTEYYVKFK